MNASVLVCLPPGSEETEAVTTIDLLVRAGIAVTLASVASDGNLEIVCSRGVRLIADAPLTEVADSNFDALVLPGGLKGAEYFRNSPVLVECIRQANQDGKIVAAMCATPAIVLEYHQLFPVGNMTGYPDLKNNISPEKWMDKRVVYDPRVNLLTTQGPGTSMDFALKIIDLLLGKEKAAEVAAQLILPPGIYNYRDESRG